MKLNKTERAVVNSSARAWLQGTLEARLLLSLFKQGVPPLEKVLEIGCGGGGGIEFLRQRLGADHVTAMDLDGQMLSLSAKRWVNQPHVQFVEADAGQMPFADASFDLVGEFAVFHHIPDWQRAVAEAARVLRPKGLFLYWDLYRAAICNPVSRRLFEHPMENRFSHGEFISQLKVVGLVPVASKQVPALAGMGLFSKTA